MELLAKNILEFLESLTLDVEGVSLEEAASNAAAKFEARIKSSKKKGKRLTPSKYLKKYGSSWQNLKNETELEGESLDEGNAENKEKKRGRLVKIGGRLNRSTPEWSIGDNAREVNTARSQEQNSGDVLAHPRTRGKIRFATKKMLAASKVQEEVIPAKGNKRDKRASTDHKELPTMPSGMNAGMRMMPEEILAEISKDKIASAYRERLKLTAAHHTVGNEPEAKKNAVKAIVHAAYHKNYDKNREKYANHATARAIIAKRAKSDATKPKED